MRELVIVLLMLATSAIISVAGNVQPFFFIQLSDPQFGFMDGNKSITAEIEAMEKAVVAINRLKPPFVVVTGDFVNQSQNEIQISAYKQMISKINPETKVYMIPGNHDIGTVNPESMEAYRKNYGAFRFSFTYNNCAFIGIDSNIIKADDKEREEAQFVWLKKELEKNRKMKFKFLFTHCSIFLKQVNEPKNYSNFPLGMREKYIRLLKEHGVNAVFAGHLHNNSYGKADNLEMITIGAVGKALGTGFQGMNLVRVYPDYYVSEYIALDQFPYRVNLSPVFNSINGLVMAGYQGWFNVPADNAGLGWKHYAKNKEFKPGKCTIELWPEISEYEKTYETAFTLADGSSARVFSSRDASTTNLHFKWMKEYGIDGAFMQRFVVSLRTKESVDNYTAILDNAIRAAEANNRAVCVMYDLSGMIPGEEDLLMKDWTRLSTKYKITTRVDNHYLYHRGKPLVAVWGIGFNDNRRYGYEQVNKIIDFLKKEGCSILVGVPAHWRTLNEDAMADIQLHKIIEKADVVHPWLVGRFDNQSYQSYQEMIKEDIIWCKMHHKDYMPVLFPGFSLHNLKEGAKLDQIPRLEGRFFWRQVAGAIDAGAKSLYLAMVDEIDEGTAFFKCTNNPPVGASPFLTYQGLESDYYLWLAGQAAKCLRGEISSEQMPARLLK